jgi:hypothetical protein
LAAWRGAAVSVSVMASAAIATEAVRLIRVLIIAPPRQSAPAARICGFIRTV